MSVRKIAEICGVSRSSVSSALAGRGRMSSATRQHILQVAREMRYRPNSIARTMNTRQFGSVALLQSTREGPGWLHPHMLMGMHDALAKHGKHLIFARFPDEELEDRVAMPRLLREWSTDGLIVHYTHMVPKRLASILEDYEIPAIWLNACHAHDCVFLDDEDAARRATEHLLRLGFQDIAYVDYARDAFTLEQNDIHYSRIARRWAYENTMRDAGLKPRVITNEQELFHKDLIEYSCHWLGQPNRPQVVLAYHSVEALTISQAALSLGLHLPEDLSLMTFEDLDEVQSCLQTTRMNIPNYDMGLAAVELLMKKMENPEQLLPAVTLHCDFAQGRTTPHLST